MVGLAESGMQKYVPSNNTTKHEYGGLLTKKKKTKCKGKKK